MSAPTASMLAYFKLGLESFLLVGYRSFSAVSPIFIQFALDELQKKQDEFGIAEKLAFIGVPEARAECLAAFDASDACRRAVTENPTLDAFAKLAQASKESLMASVKAKEMWKLWIKAKEKHVTAKISHANKSLELFDKMFHTFNKQCNMEDVVALLDAKQFELRRLDESLSTDDDNNYKENARSGA